MGSVLSSRSAASPEQLASVKQTVDGAISGDFIAVFSKSYCPYCVRAKALLNGLTLPPGKDIKVFELDKLPEGSAIQAYLIDKTGQRTVPNVFVQGKHVGGSDDLAAAHRSGKLAELIQLA